MTETQDKPASSRTRVIETIELKIDEWFLDAEILFDDDDPNPPRIRGAPMPKEHAEELI